MADLLRPYVDLPDIFASIECRSNGNSRFDELNLEDGSAIKVIIVEDLRTIPTHQLKIRIDETALGAYTSLKNSLRLLIITRDPSLRRELKLVDVPLTEIPNVIELSRRELSLTSLKQEMSLTCVVVTGAPITGRPSLPRQKASRLAEFRIHLRNSAGGAPFPYVKKTAEEFRLAGLPSEAGLHLALTGDASELIAKTDTPIANLLSVWVHEKIWRAVQRDTTGNPTAAQLRSVMITNSAIHLILGAAAPHIQVETEISEDSVVGQLLDYLDQQAGRPVNSLRTLLQEKRSIAEIEPYIQNGWRFVTTLSKDDEEIFA